MEMGPQLYSQSCEVGIHNLKIKQKTPIHFVCELRNENYYFITAENT